MVFFFIFFISQTFFSVSVKENLPVFFFTNITVKIQHSGREGQQPTRKPFVIDQLLPGSSTPYHIVRNSNGFLVIRRTTYSTHKIPSNPMFLCKIETEP